MTWTVTRYRERIAVGDQVFLWRSGRSNASVPAGIVAEAEVVAPATERLEEPEVAPFWRSAAEANVLKHRALLRLVGVARPGALISRKWVREDPILRDLLIIRQPAGTNFEVLPEHARRLDAIWTKAGMDWTRAEAVAALWAYSRTYAQEVSGLPGSAVAEVALLTGRAVSAAYQKTMNYRSLDPRDPRKGLAGGGKLTRRVWAEFFDTGTNTIRQEILDAEYARLWGDVDGSRPPVEAEVQEEALQEQANALLQLSLDELIIKYTNRVAHAPRKPRARTAVSVAFERDPYVLAIAKKMGGISLRGAGLLASHVPRRQRSPLL